MLVFPLLMSQTALLFFLHDVERHATVKRHRCAVLCKKWFNIDSLYLIRCQKEYPKAAIQYEITRIGSRYTSENEQKTGAFIVRKSALFALCTGWKKTPRARRITNSFEKGAPESSTKNTPGLREKMGLKIPENVNSCLCYSARCITTIFSSLISWIAYLGPSLPVPLCFNPP